MADKSLHLTLAMALPLNKGPLNVSGVELDQNLRPWLTNKKLAALQETAILVRRAASFCLRRFKPHEQTLWWTPLDPDGRLLRKTSGEPVQRTAGHMRVVIKLREVAQLSGFPLPAAIKDGIQQKVADLLLSYAARKIDPNFADKTGWPVVDEGFPIVWQMGFVFYENPRTGKLFLYLPLFPRGGREEPLVDNYNPTYGPSLRVFGEEEIAQLARAKGGFLLPLQFDKWGEATFIRGRSTLPVWKATHRRVDRKWLAEIMLQDKDFSPKRVELLIRNGRVFVNVACEVPTKPAVEVETFMGVSFGLEHLITVVVLDQEGNILYQRQEPAGRYERTYFVRLERLRKRGGSFYQELETFHYRQVAQIVREAVKYKACLSIEQIGNIPKGKYNPRFNLRLSYWPFGKLADLTSYKAEKEGLPKPYSVYSATVKTLCSNCGAANKGENQQISLKGPSVYCRSCGTRHNTGFNTALNLARRTQELYTKGVVAK